MARDLKNKKHLFFDLDDTLWDLEKNSRHILQQLFLEYDLNSKLNTDFDTFNSVYKTINLQLWKEYSAKQIDKHYLRNHRFNLVFNQFNYSDHNENLEITEHYLRRAPQGKHLKNGCIETLDYLKENYVLHIITNGFKEVQAIKIDGCGLRDYFKHIIVSEEHQLSKPDEQIFRLAEIFANAKKEECVMIGDNFENDVEGAINAGWEAIYFANENDKNFKGNHISNLAELKLLF